MTAVEPSKTQTIQYPERTVERAERAIRCSPFQLRLLATMRDKSVSLQAIAAESGVKHQYTRSPVNELAAQNALMWLIQVGVLRREVDGQGITDSFRLTPLGRQLVEKWEKTGGSFPAPTWRDRLYNFLNRWLRLPI